MSNHLGPWEKSDFTDDDILVAVGSLAFSSHPLGWNYMDRVFSALRARLAQHSELVDKLREISEYSGRPDTPIYTITKLKGMARGMLSRVKVNKPLSPNMTGAAPMSPSPHEWLSVGVAVPTSPPTPPLADTAREEALDRLSAEMSETADRWVRKDLNGCRALKRFADRLSDLTSGSKSNMWQPWVAKHGFTPALEGNYLYMLADGSVRRGVHSMGQHSDDGDLLDAGIRVVAYRAE